MITDYHTHSWRCGHAVGTMSEYVEAAIERGVGEIGLTDHVYLYYEPPESRNSEWAMPERQYPEHYREMIAVRDHFRDRIAVRVSVEADYVEGFEPQLREFLDVYEFDYVLGAVHFMDGWLIDAPENSGRYREESVAEIYRRYYLQMTKAVRTGLFDVMAHLDLPKKFGHAPESDVSAELNELLDTIEAKQTVVEVSTAGLRKPIGEIYPSPAIIAEIAKRNIPIVLSSDAHAPTEIAADYEPTIRLLGDFGIEQVTTFAGREKRVVPLG